ncbi:DNA polymerase I [Gordonia amarae]|uniref:DNA polymerase I n=1 Tax=Gordonia amarae TaxID=36821 RepID=A0A857LRC0_9ACTN|nr:DNA polymerase I [Gordonia amarae]MCS3879457.1 DNA polymerase-1 [Gordonia amarae]QHN17922.1 DNA polymerase I [Gordonia amarae]QHN22444.1 DNA polymerase I [Gordonia amarae]QHN31320.1 DNA polymerase I [Gordonia amarae]QHN40065.1 DNA polymerase I [Gordonia amarae]
MSPAKSAAPAQSPSARARSGKPVLMLLDGHSLAYRAFFALPAENFKTATGQTTNAVYGFTSMLINLLRDEEPTHIAAAFDVSRKTFRSELFPEYKAQRSKSPEEFGGQVELTKDVLGAMGIPVMAIDGYEADDIIATLATQAEERGFDVLVVTGDRDSLQLVDDAVTVLYPKRGVSELTRFTPEEVEKKYGVTPTQYPDIAALRGDSSDNLPGVPGVGDKTAAKWIRQYGSLSELVDHVDEIKGKVGDSLRANLASVQTNRHLTQLVRDMQLPAGPDELALVGWDRERIHALFDDLEFRVLRDRLFSTLSSVEPEAESGFDLDGSILGEGEVAGWLDAHARTGRTGISVSAPRRVVDADPSGIAIAAADGSSAYIAIPTIAQADEEALAHWLADGELTKACHDAKWAIHALRVRGWTLRGVTSDTALAAYLVRPGQRSFDLDDLSLRYLRRELKADGPEGDGQLSLLDAEGEDEAKAFEHQMLEARAVAELADALDTELDRIDSRSLLTDMELPLTFVLADLEAAGIAVDINHFRELEQQFADRVRTAADAAYEVIGEQINLGSPKQLQAVLFEKLDMPKTKKTKTGYTTDADALQGLYEKTEHPFLAHLLEHRDATRLRVTVEGLLKSVADDDRIHTTFNQTVAATGRLSSTDPNLQNIPVRTEAGRQIRHGFVVGGAASGPGFETLMTADYSQIEMRIMAHLSGDEGLIEAFNTGEDLHNFVGSRAFGVPIDEVTTEMRHRVKAMSYGLAYGLSAFGLAAQLKISREEAKAQMDQYFARFGGVRDYLHHVVDEARTNEYTATLFGRRRYLPDLNSDNWQRRQSAERMALNAPIQGTAADIIKVAMINVHKRIAAEGLSSRMLLQVHDELVVEVAAGERDAVEKLVREEMGSAITLSVPLEVSVGFGRSWDDAAH